MDKRDFKERKIAWDKVVLARKVEDLTEVDECHLAINAPFPRALVYLIGQIIQTTFPDYFSMFFVEMVVVLQILTLPAILIYQSMLLSQN